MDPFSPVAPAAVHVVVVPAGPISQPRFTDVLRNLSANASIVRAGEATVLLRYGSARESPYAPFELWREAQVLLGIAAEDTAAEDHLQRMAERYPRVIHRHLLLLPQSEGGIVADGPNMTRVAKAGADEGGLALRDAMSEVASSLVAALKTYETAVAALPTLSTPLQPPTGRMRRTWSTRNDTSGRPASGSATPPQHPPDVATSPHENSPRQSLQTMRPPSHKARSGIVIGHIQMMSGQWTDALHTFTEHTQAARKQSDNLWHGKGVEGIVVCMLLLSWAQKDFSVPSICLPAIERSSTSHVAKLSVSMSTDWRAPGAAHQAAVNRLQSTLVDILKNTLTLYEMGEAHLELPFLILAEAKIRFAKLMAALHRADGTLTAPVLASIVEGDLGATTKRSLGILNTTPRKADIADLIASILPLETSVLSLPEEIQLFTGIAQVYALIDFWRKRGVVLREMMGKLTDGLNHARKLGAAEAGVHPAASLSAETGAETIRRIAAQSQGINDLVEELASIFGITPRAPRGVNSRESTDDVHTDIFKHHPAANNDFGSAVLKAEVISTIIAFHEASPNPEGVVRATEQLLRNVIPFAAIDGAPGQGSIPLAKDEQLRLVTTISRTIGVSTHLGLRDVEADFWDPFLVRGLQFVTRDDAHQLYPLLDHGKLQFERPATTQSTTTTGGNPLLYDPNANNRAGPTLQSRIVLLRNEPNTFVLTLQNTLQVPLVVESITLVSDKEPNLKLRTQGFHHVTLDPWHVQQIRVSVLPSACEDFNIIGCRIKVSGCREAVYAVYNRPWQPPPEILVKQQGLGVQAAQDNVKRPSLPEHISLAATSLNPIPLLEHLRTSHALTALTLLEGQQQSLDITLHNSSPVPAAIIACIGTRDRASGAEIISRRTDAEILTTTSNPATTGMEREVELESEVNSVALLPANSSLTIPFKAIGILGANAKAKLQIYYRASPLKEGDKHVRILTVPFEVTVNRLLAFNPTLTSRPRGVAAADGFILAVDVFNSSTQQEVEVTISTSSEGSTDNGSESNPSRVVPSHFSLPARTQRRADVLELNSLPSSTDDYSDTESAIGQLALHWRLPSPPFAEGEIELGRKILSFLASSLSSAEQAKKGLRNSARSDEELALLPLPRKQEKKVGEEGKQRRVLCLV